MPTCQRASVPACQSCSVWSLAPRRDALNSKADQRQRDGLLRRLDNMKEKVSQIVVPVPSGDLFYGAREHVCFVCKTLLV